MAGKFFNEGETGNIKLRKYFPLGFETHRINFSIKRNEEIPTQVAN